MDLIQIEELNQRFPKGLIEELLMLPDTLKGEDNKLLAFKFKLAEIERSIGLWEVSEVAKIGSEVGLGGKKAYSNESLRDAELQRRRHNIPTVQALATELIELKSKEEAQKVEISYLERRLKVLLSITALIAAR